MENMNTLQLWEVSVIRIQKLESSLALKFKGFMWGGGSVKETRRDKETQLKALRKAGWLQ